MIIQGEVSSHKVTFSPESPPRLVLVIPTVCHNLNFLQNYFLTSIFNCSGEVLVEKDTGAFGFSVFPGYMYNEIINFF